MNFTQQRVCCAAMPLAVYRELAAHLQQVEGVEVELVSQQSSEFDYFQSQIDHLGIGYSDEAQERVEEILAYYETRYGSLEKL